MHQTTITAPKKDFFPSWFISTCLLVPAWIFKNCGFYGHSQNSFDQFSHFDCLSEGDLFSLERRKERKSVRKFFTQSRSNFFSWQTMKCKKGCRGPFGDGQFYIIWGSLSSPLVTLKKKKTGYGQSPALLHCNDMIW